MITTIDTRGTQYCKNICIWWDGTLRPMLGHNGSCLWQFDGQFYYHSKEQQ